MNEDHRLPFKTNHYIQKLSKYVYMCFEVHVLTASIVLLFGQVVILLALPEVLEATPTEAAHGRGGGPVPIVVDNGPIAIQGTRVLGTEETFHLQQQDGKQLFLFQKPIIFHSNRTSKINVKPTNFFILCTEKLMRLKLKLY